MTSYDFARMQPELYGSLLGDKAHSVVFDNSKLKRLVPGFYARVCFDQGVRRTIEYIKKHPGLQAADPGWDEWVDSIVTV